MMNRAKDSGEGRGEVGASFAEEGFEGRWKVGAPGVLLFDGECGFCVALVGFLLNQDRSGALRYAALQGEVGQVLLRRLGLPTEDFDSLVFLPELSGGRFYLRTDGVVRVLEALGGGWALTGRVLGWIPAPVRDLVYRAVARVRHWVFGRAASGGFPPSGWERRSLALGDLK